MEQPNAGDGATMVAGTDRYPVTIIKTTRKTITVQDDTATRIDENGASENQVYSIERNPNGKTYRFWKSADGTYRRTDAKSIVLRLGKRERYYDFSF